MSWFFDGLVFGEKTQVTNNSNVVPSTKQELYKFEMKHREEKKDGRGKRERGK